MPAVKRRVTKLVRKRAAVKAPQTERKPAVKDKGFIMVRVGKLPGHVSEIALNGGRTVRAALQGAELRPEGNEIRLNGGLVRDLNTAVEEGDIVLLVKQIQGNR